MKISYDKATDSLYIHLADRASVDSDEVKDGVVLDFDTNGALVGIDVQHKFLFDHALTQHDKAARPGNYRSGLRHDVWAKSLVSDPKNSMKPWT